jgi:hypothetical protein
MPEANPSRRGALLLLLASLGAAALTLALLVAVFSARLDAPTVALSVAAAALVYALAQLYAVVRALAAPDRIAQVGRGAGAFTQAELRDEKRRLLRAIKELEFDHGMGKLSQADFDAVISTYRLRAIEVMRALDGKTELHPELVRLLAEREGGEAPAAKPDERAALDVTTRICGACQGSNETDAKFCKHCGAPIRKDAAAAPRPSQAPVAGEIGGSP